MLWLIGQLCYVLLISIVVVLLINYKYVLAIISQYFIFFNSIEVWLLDVTKS